MSYSAIIIAAAKSAKVSGSLLLAICSHESNLVNVLVPHDGNSPSYGICQIKYDTAIMVGFKGKPVELLNPSINASIAAKYLKYQQDRYGSSDWCRLTSAYNAGSYNESKVVPGKPRNLKYVRKVQAKLEDNLRYRLSCDM